MGQPSHRRARWWSVPLVALIVMLCALPFAASAQASSSDQLANITARDVASAGAGGIKLGDIPLGPNITITGVRFGFRGVGRVQFAGGIRLRCLAGGDITGYTDDDLSFTSLRNWSVKLGGKAGPNGCALTKNFSLAANSGADITLKAVNGKFSVEINLAGTLNTTLIPTKTSFSAEFRMLIAGGDYSTKVSGSTQGASFTGAIASNGTFELAFNLDDLTLGGISLGAHGRIAKTTPQGRIETSLGGSLKAKIQILPGLWFLGGEVGWDNGAITFAGSIRVKCQTGSMDLSAAGTLKDARNFELSAKGVSSPCGFGNVLRFKGETFFGILKMDGGVFTYDLGGAIDRLDLGALSLTRNDSFGLTIDTLQARITNACVGCDNNDMRVTFGGHGELTLRLSILPRGLKFGAGLKGLLDFQMPSFALKRVQIALTGLSVGNAPMGTDLFLQAELERRITEVFTTPAGRSSGSTALCPNTSCTTEVTASGPSRSAAASAPAAKQAAKGKILSMKVGVADRRADIRVRTSAPATVSVDLQQRRCLAGTCTWALKAYGQPQSNASGSARFRPAARLSAGRYRVVARVGTSRTAKAVTKSFAVTRGS